MSGADEAVIASQLEPTDYAVYGVLCAAKIESGPMGARRAWRIGVRLEVADQAVEKSLRKLIRMGWVEQEQRNEFGFVYFKIRADNGYSVKLESDSE